MLSALDTNCFEGAHAALAVTSLVLFPVFVLLAVVVSGLYVNHNPLSNAVSSKQHGRMDAYFVLLRLILTVVVDTAGGVLPAWLQWLAQVGVAGYWVYTFVIMQPDTVPWMNQLQAALACGYAWSVTAVLHATLLPGSASMAALLLHGIPLSAALGWVMCTLHRGRILGKRLGDLSEWHEFVLWSRERLRVQHTAKRLQRTASRGGSISGFASSAMRSGGHEYRPEESVAPSEMLAEERGQPGARGQDDMEAPTQHSLGDSATSPSVGGAATATVMLNQGVNMPLAAARTHSALQAGIAWSVSHSGGHSSWTGMLGDLAPATIAALATAMEAQAEAGYAAAMSRFPTDGLLRVFAAAYYRSTRDSRYMEIVQLNAAKKLSSAVDVQFFVYQRIQAVRNKYNGKAGSSLSAIDRLLYEQHWNDALRSRVACYEAMAEVWAELRQATPDLRRLERNAVSLHSAVTSARARFDAMLRLHASAKVYAAYGNFMTAVLGDEAEGAQMLQRASQLSQEAEGTSRGSVVQHFRFGERSKTIAAMNDSSAVVTASGDPSTIGQITQVNAVACRLLGRSRADLVGSNVSTIVPRPISDIHNKLMMRYAKTGKGNLVGTTRNLFAMSAGNLIPVRGGLMEAPPREEDAAPQFAMVLQEVSCREEFIIFGGEETAYRVFSASAGTHALLGTSAETLSFQEVSAAAHFPEVDLEFSSLYAGSTQGRSHAGDADADASSPRPGARQHQPSNSNASAFAPARTRPQPMNVAGAMPPAHRVLEVDAPSTTSPASHQDESLSMQLSADTLSLESASGISHHSAADGPNNGKRTRFGGIGGSAHAPSLGGILAQQDATDHRQPLLETSGRADDFRVTPVRTHVFDAPEKVHATVQSMSMPGLGTLYILYWKSPRRTGCVFSGAGGVGAPGTPQPTPAKVRTDIRHHNKVMLPSVEVLPARTKSPEVAVRMSSFENFSGNAAQSDPEHTHMTRRLTAEPHAESKVAYHHSGDSGMHPPVSTPGGNVGAAAAANRQRSSSDRGERPVLLHQASHDTVDGVDRMHSASSTASALVKSAPSAGKGAPVAAGTPRRHKVHSGTLELLKIPGDTPESPQEQYENALLNRSATVKEAGPGERKAHPPTHAGPRSEATVRETTGETAAVSVPADQHLASALSNPGAHSTRRSSPAPSHSSATGLELNRRKSVDGSIAASSVTHMSTHLSTMRRLLTGAAQVAVPAVLRIARVYWVLIGVMIAFAIGLAAMRSATTDNTLLVHKLIAQAGVQSQATAKAGATIRALQLLGEGLYPASRIGFLNDIMLDALVKLGDSYRGAIETEQSLPLGVSVGQPFVTIVIDNAVQEMTLRDGVGWVLSHLQTIVGSADPVTGLVDMTLPDVQALVTNTVVDGSLMRALREWLSRLQQMNEDFTDQQLVTEVALFSAAFLLLMVLTAVLLWRQIQTASRARARSMQALLLLPRQAVKRLSSRAARAITAVLQDEEQNTDDNEGLHLEVSRNMSGNAATAREKATRATSAISEALDDTWMQTDDTFFSGQLQEQGTSMRMLGTPRKHVDSGRFRLRWACLLTAPLVLLGIWLGSMFAVQVNIVTQADQAAHRVELTSELINDAMQLYALSVIRGATPDAVPTNGSLQLAALLTRRTQEASRRLLHGDTGEVRPFESELLRPLQSDTRAFRVYTENACDVVAPALVTRAFQPGDTCASVQGGVAARGLALMVNKYLQESNRYIALRNASGVTAQAQLASVSQQAVPLLITAAQGFTIALDEKTESQFREAQDIDAVLTAMFVIVFAAAVLLFFIPKMRLIGTSVQSVRALLVLLAPTLLGADSGSTMMGVLTTLASEVAAEQTIVNSMPAASLCGGNSNGSGTGASLRLAGSSAAFDDEDM